MTDNQFPAQLDRYGSSYRGQDVDGLTDLASFVKTLLFALSPDNWENSGRRHARVRGTGLDKPGV